MYILFKYLLTFSGLYYAVASLIINFVLSIQKCLILIGIISHVPIKRLGYLKKSKGRMIRKLVQLSSIEQKDVTYVIE